MLLIPAARPLCVEAKLESKQASYPVRLDECAIFDRVVGSGGRVGQLELQGFMFESLLGKPCQSVVIDNTRHSTGGDSIQGSDVTFLTWAEVFDHLDAGSSIPFVHRLLGENRIIYRERAAEDV